VVAFIFLLLVETYLSYHALRNLKMRDSSIFHFEFMIYLNYKALEKEVNA